MPSHASSRLESSAVQSTHASRVISVEHNNSRAEPPLACNRTIARGAEESLRHQPPISKSTRPHTTPGLLRGNHFTIAPFDDPLANLTSLQDGSASGDNADNRIDNPGVSAVSQYCWELVNSVRRLCSHGGGVPLSPDAARLLSQKLVSSEVVKYFVFLLQMRRSGA